MNHLRTETPDGLARFVESVLVHGRGGGLHGLEHAFEHVISTDRIKSDKPHPSAYQTGIDTLGLGKEEIVFVAFAGWDAAGARSLGYTTFWVNRLHLPAERLGVSADGKGADLGDLVRFVPARV